MPVKKMFGPNGQISPVVRFAFLGDPASLTVPDYTKTTTARGRRRSSQTDEYMQNLSVRQAQSAPAGKTRKYHKGPRSRPSKDEVSSSEYVKRMLNKTDWDC